MKKLITLLSLLLLVSSVTLAQKFAYVDTDYILKQIPEYNQAQAELNIISAQWQQEIEAKYKEINTMRRNYQAELILLSDDMKEKREKAIQEKEKAAQDLQKKRFGVNGQLFKKKQSLIKPIQDKVYKSIKATAAKYGLSIIFDKASSLTMLYTSKKLDKSDAVLKHMGYEK